MSRRTFHIATMAELDAAQAEGRKATAYCGIERVVGERHELGSQPPEVTLCPACLAIRDGSQQ